MIKERILIFGASEHARCVIDIIEQVNNYQIVGVIDLLMTKGSAYQDYEILGNVNDLPEIIEIYNVHKGVIAIGDNYLRSRNAQIIKMSSIDFSFVSAIHPSVILGKNVIVGNGTVMMAGVIVNNDTTIGEHCYLSTKVSLGHDSVLADFSSLSPGVTAGGRTTIGMCSVVGIGTNILHGRTIGDHSVIGSGSLVVKDIENYVVAYGSPAKVVKTREIGEKYL